MPEKGGDPSQVVRAIVDAEDVTVRAFESLQETERRHAWR
jgi:hypothetical protein